MSGWLREYIATRGIVTVIKDAIKNIFKIGITVRKRIFSVMEVMVFQIDLEKPTILIEASISMRIEKVSSENIGDILQVEAEYKVPQFKKLMHCDEVGYYVYTDSHITHRCWVVEQSGPAPTCGGYHSFQLGEKEYFVHFSKTYPEFQKKRIYPAALSQLCVLYKKYGYIRGFIAVETSNHPSLKGVERMGYQPMFRQKVFFIMGFVFRFQGPV